MPIGSAPERRKGKRGLVAGVPPCRVEGAAATILYTAETRAITTAVTFLFDDAPGLAGRAAQEGEPTMRTFTLIIVALVAAVVGAAAGHFGGRHMHGWHHGPWGHHRFGHDISPDDMQRRVEWMVGRLARRTDATSEQQAKLQAIAKAAVTDLHPLRQKFSDAHKRAHELLRQPTIDRAALEALRAEQIANADAASKRLIQALSDMAEVLTPEQRKALLDRFDRFDRDDD
jgi:Spy/CpxP family protein refolding chaperone